MAQAVVASLSLQRLWFVAWSVHMGFVVDKVALGQDFPCQYHSTMDLHTHISGG
jgi:hypothetical protein